MERQFIALDPDSGDISGDNFQPGQLWHFGIDIYVGEVELYWVSPGGEEVLLGTRDSVGLWQMTSPPEGIFFFSVVSTPGSRVWVMT